VRAAGAGRVRDDHARTRDEVPAEPADDREPGDDRPPHTAVVREIAVSVVSAVAAIRVRRDALRRLGGWNAGIVAAGAYLALIAAAELMLPAVHETPAGFPAEVLWRFRVASLGINATLWTAIGLGFGAAAERRIMDTNAARPPRGAGVTSRS
jgi:hypothetical protein